MKLIDKVTLSTEIENRIKEAKSMQPKFDQFWAGQISAFKGVLKIIDTIEVKEVDLEKEYKKFIDCDNGRSMFETAKYFFELGLKAKEK